MLPTPLLSLLALALALPGHASPSPPHLFSDAYMHLMPRHHLFFRQLADLQTFTETVGGVAASSITQSGDDKRTFSVEGETFTDFDSAAKRTCDVQFDGCQKKANEPESKGVLSVGDCDAQKGRCNDAQQKARVKDFQSSDVAENIGPDPAFPDFDLICDA